MVIYNHGCKRHRSRKPLQDNGSGTLNTTLLSCYNETVKRTGPAAPDFDRKPFGASRLQRPV